MTKQATFSTDPTPDHTVEVFRQLYAAVGFGLLVWPTRLPGITHAMDFGYHIFAKNRLRLTGRCTTETCEVS